MYWIMTEYVDQWFHEWVREAGAEYGRLNKKHDKGYKYLLSFKRIFIQLVKSFINEGWVSQI